ncbi:MAG: DUF1836 domain-containing protein [Ruminococcaceae bacterium]|nr:DUF1836 domain-containing protein [Oscillospiraceae bacterium]
MIKEKERNFACPVWSDFPDIELYMDQVISVLERYLTPFFPEEEKCITSTMINNYVKQRLLPPPENKRYGKKHLAYLFMISILKRFMQLSEISTLLDHLVREMGEEGAFNLFSAELTASLARLFEETERSSLSEKGKCARVVRTCCDAFSAILYAKSVFSAARLLPKETPEEKKDKVKEKEKKEKKDKEKGKKE